MLRITITLAVAIALISGPRGTDASQACPLYWTRFQHQCYRLFKDDNTLGRVEAEDKCNQYSSCSGSIAHLPSASSPAEFDFLKIWISGIYPDFGTQSVRIGLYTDANMDYFTYDYTYVNRDYPHIPHSYGGDSYGIQETAGLINTLPNEFYVCKMHTTGNTNFKDEYFDTTQYTPGA